jgi:tetratricopeptide (TPR) repeat protein
MKNHRFLFHVGLLASAFFSAEGRALADERDPAAAQALFDEARKLSSAGRYPEACAKLAESNRLDPGIGTQFHLADCHEKSGKIASAWAMFLEVASQARASAQSDREKAALKRAAQLESKLPRLRIEVPEANRVNGLEIHRDGVLVGSAQWGTPVPVDPGEHELVATAPGRRTIKQKFRADAGKTAALELPLLEVDPNAPAAPAAASQAFVPVAVAATPENTPTPTQDKQDETTGSSGPGPWPYVLGGAGLVGIGVATVFALMAKSSNDDSMAECRPDNPNVCNSEGVAMREDALAQGNVASVAFIAGSAALAGAGIWLLLDSGSSDEKPHTALAAGLRPTSGGATVTFKGTF